MGAATLRRPPRRQACPRASRFCRRPRDAARFAPRHPITPLLASPYCRCRGRTLMPMPKSAGTGQRGPEPPGVTRRQCDASAGHSPIPQAPPRPLAAMRAPAAETHDVVPPAHPLPPTAGTGRPGVRTQHQSVPPHPARRRKAPSLPPPAQLRPAIRARLRTAPARKQGSDSVLQRRSVEGRHPPSEDQEGGCVAAPANRSSRRLPAAALPSLAAHGRQPLSQPLSQPPSCP